MNTKERIKFALTNTSVLSHLAQLSASRVMGIRPVTYPFVLQINLDTVCNVQCFICAYLGRYDKPHFDIRNLDKLGKAITHAKHLSLSAWGDPVVSPNLLAVLDKIYSYNSHDNLIAIVTNGTRLTPGLARKLTGHLAGLTVSLNAGNASTYEQDIKGAHWNETLAVVSRFMQALKPEDRRKVSLHVVAHRGNYAELADVVKIADGLGISKVRADQFTVNKREYLPLSLVNIKGEYNKAVELAKLEAGVRGIEFTARIFGKEHGRQPCLSPWVETHIWADGRVAPCDCNGTFFLGNAYESGFEAVWFGKAYQEFRKHPASQCQSCPKACAFDDERGHVSPYLTEEMAGE